MDPARIPPVGECSNADADAPKGSTTSTDVERTMRLRARTGYCADAAKNLQILHNENLNETSRAVSHSSAHGSRSLHSGMCRLWRWVDRVESFEQEEQGTSSYEGCGVLV